MNEFSNKLDSINSRGDVLANSVTNISHDIASTSNRINGMENTFNSSINSISNDVEVNNMLISYNAYVTKKVQCFKYVEYANDLMIGDYVEGCNGFTMVDSEPKTAKANHYYVLEHNGRTTMLEPNTYVKMADGSYKLPEELCKGDVLFPKQALQYIGHANQPLYMVKIVTGDNTIKANGLYIKGGK